MKVLNFRNISIEFQFNEPVEETGFLSEDFNPIPKPAYATPGVIELLGVSELEARNIIGRIFTEFHQTAKIQKLDYLQKLSVNGTEIWCIDNGSTICLLTKEEY